jgi:pimeloyl-ACP methyl ester carboxylesterase
VAPTEARSPHQHPGRARPGSGLVLLHGGVHTAGCWDFVVDAIRHLSPDLPVLAVNLPGRTARRGDRRAMSVEGYAEAVISAVDAAGLSEVVVVGHSLAGLTVPRVVAGLGLRVREIVLIAAVTPPQGQSVLDRLPWPMSVVLRRLALSGRTIALPRPLAHLFFWNGVPAPVRRVAASHLCREFAHVLLEPADYSSLSTAVPRTWILTGRDRILSRRRQRFYIDAIGGVDTVLQIDSGHDAMFSHPLWLAESLAARCRPPEAAVCQGS